MSTARSPIRDMTFDEVSRRSRGSCREARIFAGARTGANATRAPRARDALAAASIEDDLLDPQVQGSGKSFV